MTFSQPVRGKYKMNWWEYWIGHCWMTGWQSIRGAFRVWCDLMTSNYNDYDLPRTVEDPEAECIEWFWVYLGEDDTYPKEFLEDLYEMCARIDRGEEKLIPLDENFFKDIEKLLETEEDESDV
jgi:hypothetical protein